jgi:hypothetical protein
LPRIARELYQSARRLRVFVAKPVARAMEDVALLIALPTEALRERLGAGRKLLQ